MQLNDISNNQHTHTPRNLMLHVAQAAHVSIINNEHDDQQKQPQQQEEWWKSNVHSFRENNKKNKTKIIFGQWRSTAQQLNEIKKTDRMKLTRGPMHNKNQQKAEK